MSESQPSRVYMAEGDDPEMQKASEQARATFRYFWREVAWERRRIVPALDLACVKVPFSDGPRPARSRTTGGPGARPPGTPEVELMWLDEVDFDGQLVGGVLLNTPNWLKTVKAGDPAHVPLDQVSDWMYAI